MKELLSFVLFIFIQGMAFCQADWKHILNKTSAYYIKATEGSVRVLTAYKNVLKSDTNYISRSFIYYRDSLKYGKLFTDSYNGFSIYIRNEAYYVLPESMTYFKEENSSNRDDLLFLPHWDPFSFFFQFFYMGAKNGVVVDSAETGNYILRFNNNDDAKFVLCIDRNRYNLVKYTEIITHKKFGEQFNEHIFDEQSISGAKEKIIKDMDLVLMNYVHGTDKTIKEHEKKQKKIKDKLLGKKINRKLLFELLFEGGGVQYSNSYILLDYYYQSCLPCIEAIPSLNKLRREFSDTSKLVIVGVDPIPEDSGQKEKFSKKYNVLYPLVDGEKAIEIKRITLPGLSIGYPTMILIAPDGTIKRIMEYYSEAHFRDLKKYFKKHLK